MNINIAPTGKHCCIALYDRLILLGVTSDDKELYIRSSLDIIEGHRMFYSTLFSRDSIQVWRFSADPYSNKCVITGWKHKNVDKLRNRRIDIKDISRMAVEFRLTNESIPMMELVSDNTHDMSGVYNAPYSVQAFRQHLFNSECGKNILKEFMTGSTSPYDEEISDDELGPSTKTLMSVGTNTIEMTTDCGMSETSLYFIHQQFNQEMENNYMELMTSTFVHDRSADYIRALPILSVLVVAHVQINPIPIGLISSALDIDCLNVYNIMSNEKLLNIVHMVGTNDAEIEDYVLTQNVKCALLFRWLSSKLRAGREFYIDETVGHSYLCSMYLKYCSNKSVAVGKSHTCKCCTVILH